jgi:hypothetical protein
MFNRITLNFIAVLTLFTIFFLTSSFKSNKGEHLKIDLGTIDESEAITHYEDNIKIVFNMEIKGIPQIFISDKSFVKPVQLTKFNSWSTNPRFSPDGSKIVYAHDNSTGEWRGDIWVMNIDGSNNHQITFSETNGTRNPCWHNNGKQIIYEWGSTTTEQVIRIVNIDGKDDRVLFNNIDDKDTDPYMNPVNSNLIAYLFDSGNWTFDRQVRIRDINAKMDKIIIPSNGNADYGLSYSKDGKYLLWSEHSPNFEPSYLKKVNLSTLEIITLLTTNKHVWGKFTSDNQSIVYCSKSIVNGESSIWLMDKDGNKSINLFKTDNQIHSLDINENQNQSNEKFNAIILVKDASGRPLKGINVYIDDGSACYLKVTDSNGKVTASVLNKYFKYIAYEPFTAGTAKYGFASDNGKTDNFGGNKITLYNIPKNGQNFYSMLDDFLKKTAYSYNVYELWEIFKGIKKPVTYGITPSEGMPGIFDMRLSVDKEGKAGWLLDGIIVDDLIKIMNYYKINPLTQYGLRSY